jgi:drug/metabolite transporter (DMT)-like permease
MIFSPTRGLGLSLCGSVFLATNYITGKYALADFNVATFSLVWASAAAFFSAISLVSDGKWRQALSLKRQTFYALWAVGFLTSAGMVFTWKGLNTIDPSLVAFIMRFTPLIAIGLARGFLKDHFGKMELIPAGLMIIGSLLSAVGRWRTVGSGVVYCLLACGAIAGQTFICRLFVDACGPRILVFYRSFGAAVFISFWASLSGNVNFTVPVKIYVASILGALVAAVIGQLLLFRSYLYWPFSRSMVVYTTQPLFVALLSWVCLNRAPDVQGFLSGLIIMVGAFWFSWIYMRKEEWPFTV